MPSVADQGRDGDRGADATEACRAVWPGREGELHREQAEQGPPQPAGEPQREQRCDSGQGLGRGEQEFLDLAGIQVQRGCATAEEIGEGEAADDTLLEIRVPIAAAPLPRTANRIATTNSGASDASGANHCTSRN